MPETEAASPTQRHAVFLERANRPGAPDRVPLGGFLTLRLVERFADSPIPANGEALRYQLRGTREFVQTLPSCDERAILEAVLAGAELALTSDPADSLWSPLRRYAEWLEGELHFAEAEDVLTTALHVFGDTPSTAAAAAHLELARVLRQRGEFERSLRFYDLAGRMARTLGDDHMERLSRIGHAYTLQKTGNLPASEQMLRDVLAEAAAVGDRDGEARASHDLAVCLVHMGRAAEAAPHAFRAFQLYTQPIQRTRALSDTGQILKALGHLDAARKALLAVLERRPPLEIRLRATVELLDLSALAGDRVSFERRRREMESQYARLPVDEQADLQLKLALGLAQFGHTRAARERLRNLVLFAEEQQLREWLFRAERSLEELEHRGGGRAIAAPSRVSDTEDDLRATVADLDGVTIEHLAMDVPETAAT
jgi:tetratricopeptide (TPR) repeat protein